MPHSTPAFWYQPEPTLTARLLQPLSWLYGQAAQLHGTLRSKKPYYAGVPVISFGNLTVGGAGKTPLVHALAQHFAQQGHSVAIVSRGYGGNRSITRWPTLVDPTRHIAAQVGDEPLMLARSFPTLPVQVWVCPNRPAAVRRAEQAGATLILLDDGFQRRDLARTLDLLVLDARHGLTSAFGNGLPLPAGPLREFLPARARAHFAIALNEPAAPAGQPLPYYGLPAYRLSTRLTATTLAALPAKTPLVAFAGLGHPQKFFTSLTSAGRSPVATVSYPDHHRYTAHDLQQLRSLAQQHNAILVTTQKDAVKLPPAFAHALPLEIYGPDLPLILTEIATRLR